MILLDNSIISDDIYKSFFCCDLIQCKGACCIEGDAGAPLEEEEISQLNTHLQVILPFLPDKAIKTLNRTGVFELDREGKKVTPLVDGKECAFVFWDNGIANCAIEKANKVKNIPLIKPISCHLYPIKIIDYEEFDAINIHNWHICSGAREKGNKQKIPVYIFLQDALKRKYGEDWYLEMVQQIENLP